MLFSKSPLVPFNPSEIAEFLSKLQLANGVSSTTALEPPFITGRIMAHLQSIYPEAEVSNAISTYPPNHLHSVCALWQSYQELPAQSTPTHFALFVFLLFDAVAINALDNRSENDGREVHVVGRVRLATETDKKVTRDSVSRVGPVAKAVQLVSIDS